MAAGRPPNRTKATAAPAATVAQASACGVDTRVGARRLMGASVTFNGVAMADVVGHQR